MQIHDWTRVDPGLFHDFHQVWTVGLCKALNSGALPPQYFALVEQPVRAQVPDFLTLRLSGPARDREGDPGGRAVATAPPRTRLVCRHEGDTYAARGNLVTVRHRHGDIVAIIELISPGNKSSKVAFQTLIEKAALLIRQGIHLLIIDLFPPTRRDPQGIHKALWDEFVEEDVVWPADKPLTLAAYDAGPPQMAYVESVGVGDVLPEMPLFLKPGIYVPVPLESTYGEAWAQFPAPLKGLLTGANG